jgi:hypothetical protein
MAGVHRLKHVQRFSTTNLANDDPVGPHPQRVAYEVANGDLSATFDVGRSCLERGDVRLGQTELRGIFDRDQPLIVGDRTGRNPEHRRLAGACSAADDDVRPAANA